MYTLQYCAITIKRDNTENRWFPHPYTISRSTDLPTQTFSSLPSILDPLIAPILYPAGPSSPSHSKLKLKIFLFEKVSHFPIVPGQIACQTKMERHCRFQTFSNSRNFIQIILLSKFKFSVGFRWQDQPPSLDMTHTETYTHTHHTARRDIHLRF